jgi:TetR/AcrR family transcriptional repressor of nem operon
LTNYLPEGRRRLKSITSTSDKIFDAAQSLVVAGGYNGFSYADISAAIGIRKASIHHHFPTKAELVAVLVDRYRQQAEAGLNSLREQSASPAEQLQSYLNFWQTCIRDASLPFCICAMLVSEMQMLPQEVASRVRAHAAGRSGAKSVPLGQAA